MAEPYFGRCYKLELGDKLKFETEMDKAALDIRFSVTRALEGKETKGSVSILGLSLDTMQPFMDLAAMEQGTAWKQRMRIKLFAGYYGTGMVPIIDGYAIRASITAPPEMWLNIIVNEAPVGGLRVTPSIPFSSDPIPIGKVAKQIFEQFGMGFQDLTEDKLSEKVKISSFGEGEPITLDTAIAKISEYAEWSLVLEQKVVWAYDKNQNKSGKAKVQINKNTGLLAVDGITVTDGIVTARLQVQDMRLGRLVLKSELNKQANGEYKVTKIDYVGHFRGNEWFTRYHCTNRLSGKKK